MSPLFYEIVGLALLFCLSGFFSSSESALFSLNPLQIHRIRARHARAGARIEALLSQPTRLLFTILVGNTIVNVVAAGLGYTILEHLLPGNALIVAIPVMTVLLLIFGEITPKQLALLNSESVAVLFAVPLQVFQTVVSPLRVILDRTTRHLQHSLMPRHVSSISEEEFKTAVDEGEERGLLDREERVMVEGIIRLEDLHAADIMTPRVDLVGIDLADVEEDEDFDAVEFVRGWRFKYLPLYRETLDHIEGFLDVPRFLLDKDHNLEEATTPPLFVAETAPLDNLLTLFRREKRRIACVSDEFGGTAGVLSQGDILEEIVADVDDHNNDHAEVTPIFEQLAENRWMLGGDASLEEINYQLGLDLDAEGVRRLGGWIAAHLERLARPGDVVEAQGCRAVVRGVRKRRVLTAILERLETAESGDEEVSP